MANVIVHRPQPGFQERLLRLDNVNFLIAGSGAGVGKTWALLFSMLRHTPKNHYYGVIFRKTYLQIFASLIPQALELYSGVRYSKFVKSPRPVFNFYDDPQKKKIRSLIQFAHLLYDNDVYAWQGAEVSRFAFDEITHFSQSQVVYMFSRLRSQADVVPQILGTCNPDPDSFIKDILDNGGYLMPDGFANPDMVGKIRWVVHKNDEWIFGDDKDELSRKTKIDLPMSFSFIPGVITQNKIMLDKNPQYLSMLQGLSDYEKEILLHGSWAARRDGDIFKSSMFHTYWEDDVTTVINLSRKAIFVDTALTVGAASDWTVFLAAGVTPSGKLVILDVLRVKVGGLETFRLAEAFYRKHDRAEYNLINFSTGQKTTVRSAPMLGLFCEWQNNGITILQYLKKDLGLRVGPIKRSGSLGKIRPSDYGNRGNDKISRAIAALPLIQKAGIWLPGGDTLWSGHDGWIDNHQGIQNALKGAETVKTDPKVWVAQLKNELLGFRQGETKKEVASQHDDVTDTVIDAATYLLDSRGLAWVQGMLAMGV